MGLGMPTPNMSTNPVFVAEELRVGLVLAFGKLVEYALK